MANLTRARMRNQNCEHWVDRLYHLRQDKFGSHERPHKPVLLLSIIDLLDSGLLSKNRIELSDELIETFRRYFDIVRKHNDRPTIQNPFYFLRSDGFWELIPKEGQNQPCVPVSVSRSVLELRRHVSYGRFDDELWALLSDAASRHQLREAIYARYFPDERSRLLSVSGTAKWPIQPEALDIQQPPGRDHAFRKTILEVYDYRCAACGLRVLLEQRESLVEAAHLIPFKESRNDKPTNGMALCPNHHWAMDHNLIAPCPDSTLRAGVWRVNHARLDVRIEGQCELIAIERMPVIPPHADMYYPAPESLRWRESTLQS